MEIYKLIIGVIFITTLPFLFLPTILAVFGKHKHEGLVAIANFLLIALIYFGIFYTIQNTGPLWVFLVILEIITLIILWLLCLKYATK